MIFLEIYKENKELIMKALLILVAFTCLMGACSYLNKKAGLEDDNPVEEIIEQQIDNHTGIDIDLTPESPE